MDARQLHDWLTEIVVLGGSIHQDEDPPLAEGEDAKQQAGIERYCALLDALAETADLHESAAVVEAILWSLHPIDDYGIYEAAYSALGKFSPAALATAAGRVLPTWLARHGNHQSIQSALLIVVWNQAALGLLLTDIAGWSPEQRDATLPAVRSWALEDEVWEPVVEALGGALHTSKLDPIPTDWPDDWRKAAEGFREEGRVDLAWTNQRDIPSNFERVFALMELGHGKRWREVPDFLNPLVVRRRDQLPVFQKALDALEDVRRKRILAAIAAANPRLAERLSTDY